MINHPDQCPAAKIAALLFQNGGHYPPFRLATTSLIAQAAVV
jgi:hypothetical protein